MSDRIAPPLREALTAAVGSAGLRTEPDDLAYFGADRCRGDWPVEPSIIVMPKTVAQVQQVVRACAAHNASIVPSGGRTGLAGAATATAGEVVLALDRMNQILHIDPAGRTLRCEAGVTVQQAQEAAAEQGLLYPVDYASTGTSQVGGSIATNAGGVKVIRYGTTRAWVAGLKAVVASGEVFDLGGGLVKDNTGYDLRHLFIGSEGTLGIIVEATLRLTTPPRETLVALCAVPDDAKILEVFARVQHRLPLLAFECFDQGCLRHVLQHRGIEGAGPFNPPSPQHVLMEVEVVGTGSTAADDTTEVLAEVLGDAEDAGEISQALLAATPSQAKDLWALREDVSESLHPHRPHKADVALPVARVTEFAVAWREAVGRELPEAEAVVFGHVGDGNLHLNILNPPHMEHAEFLERCHRFDETTYAMIGEFAGSISAEHGVGLLKRDHLHHSRSAAQIEAMRGIKAVLDPKGIFNPGKVFTV